MSNISTAPRYLASAKPNADLVDLNDPQAGRPLQDKDNAEFLARVTSKLGQHGSQPLDGQFAIGLVGEYGQRGYAMRRAQEVVRVDRTPSYWSHAFLFLDPPSSDAADNRDPARSARILEASLHASNGPGELFAFRHGVSVRRFSDYVPTGFTSEFAPGSPNIAFVCLGLSIQEREAIAERATQPEADMLTYDLPDLIGTWLHYALSCGKQLNPLVNGMPMASAALLQLIYDAAGIDLFPGSNARNGTPEHIWQAVRFLHPMFEAPLDGELRPRPFVGYHCVREKNCLPTPGEYEAPKSFAAFVTQP